MRTLKLLGAVGLVLVILGACLLVPCTQQVRISEARTLSVNNLRNIAIALHGYHDTYKRLPPAVVRDQEGKPLYSWRVLILPWLEYAHLYNAFHLDEPWNSPHNKALAERTPPCYYTLKFPNDPDATTRYQVFTGPGTAFERAGLTWNDFPDGVAETVLVVEAGTPVFWSEPADLTYDPNGPLPPLGAGFSRPIRLACYNVGRQRGFNVAFADGSWRFLRDNADEQTLRGLITRNGGEAIDWARAE